MRKKKLILNKETVKNLTLNSEELGGVVGGFTTTANTGATCRSCGGSCINTGCAGCGVMETGTPQINPTYMTGPVGP